MSAYRDLKGTVLLISIIVAFFVAVCLATWTNRDWLIANSDFLANALPVRDDRSSDAGEPDYRGSRPKRFR